LVLNIKLFSASEKRIGIYWEGITIPAAVRGRPIDTL
jgi:hypothetical protein